MFHYFQTFLRLKKSRDGWDRIENLLLFVAAKNNGYPAFTRYPLFRSQSCLTDAIIVIFRITVL